MVGFATGPVLGRDDCSAVSFDSLLAHDLLHDLIDLRWLLLFLILVISCCGLAIICSRCQWLHLLFSIIWLFPGSIHFKCRFVDLLEHLELILYFIVDRARVLLEGLPLRLHLLEQL